MAKVKLVAESFEEYTSPEIQVELNEEKLDESSKGQLQRFMKNPEKREKNFLAAFARQFSKTGGQNLKKRVAKIDLETKKKLAQQSLKAFEKDPKKGYAWFQITNNKITGAGAVGVKKGELGPELGQNK